MLRKALMLLVVAGVLACTTASQANPIALTYSDYYGWAHAYNTDDIENEFHTPSPPGSTTASIPNAIAYASAGMNGHSLFFQASQLGETTAEGWAGVELHFKGPASGQVFLKFDYHLEAATTGNANAVADYSGDFYPSGGSTIWSFYDHAEASTSGEPGDMNGLDSKSGNVNEVWSVTPGDDYLLIIGNYWSFAEGYADGSDSYAKAWIDNFSLSDDGTNTPPPDPTPAPATWLLLGSGLSGLVGWRRFRKS